MGPRQRDERDEGKRGCREKRVAVGAELHEYRGGDRRAQDSGHSPRREQDAVVHAEVPRSIEIGRRGSEDRDLGAVAPVDEGDQ